MINRIPMNVRRMMQYLLVQADLTLSREEREKVMCFSAIFIYSEFAAKLSAGVLSAMYNTTLDAVFFQMGAAAVVAGEMTHRDSEDINQGEFPLTKRDLELFGIVLSAHTGTAYKAHSLSNSAIEDVLLLTALSKTLHSYFTMTRWAEIPEDNEVYVKIGEEIAQKGYV